VLFIRNGLYALSILTLGFFICTSFKVVYFKKYFEKCIHISNYPYSNFPMVLFGSVRRVLFFAGSAPLSELLALLILCFPICFVMYLL